MLPTMASPWLIPIAHAETHPALDAPAIVQFLQARAHSEGGPRRRLGVRGRAVAVHVSPDRHDRVADEFIERAIVLEDHRHHAAQIFD